MISISDLFALIKQYDKEFSPQPVSEHVLNEDGTPKELYHGTEEMFSAFSYGKIGEATGVGHNDLIGVAKNAACARNTRSPW